MKMYEAKVREIPSGKIFTHNVSAETESEGKIKAVEIHKQTTGFDSEVISMTIIQSDSSNSAAAGIMIAGILALLFAPVLVILGMRGKFLLKKLYAKCSGEEYNKFVKFYTYIGIGIYVLTAVLIIFSKIFDVMALIDVAVAVLMGGDIAYFVLSIILTKKFKVQNQ